MLERESIPQPPEPYKYWCTMFYHKSFPTIGCDCNIHVSFVPLKIRYETKG